MTKDADKAVMDYLRLRCQPLPDQGECEECGRKFRNVDVEAGLCIECGLPLPDGQGDDE